jgi:hypothetical protein
MTLRLLAAILLLAATACTHPGAPPPALAASAGVSLPPDARPNLSPRWVTPAGAYNWPPDEGFAGAPVAMVLPAGMLLDRFGGDGGNFFSPKGAPFAARALPTLCANLVYKVYRVSAPLLAWTGKAAPWFDEPGGATQFETDAPVYLLLADHIIEPVPVAGPKPCGEH